MDCHGKPAWDIEELVADLGQVPTLTGKPKVFVVQACRGGQ